MASEKEITSTEKLLDVIRGGSEKPEEAKADSDSPQGSLFAGRFARQKGVTIGVDIGYSKIRFVRVSQISGKRWKLLDYSGVTIPDDLARGTAKFATFLKEALSRYCGPPGKSDIWAMMSTANVEVRNISVPVVTRKELENVVYWSAKKELAFRDEENIFDYEVQGQTVESGVEKLGILFYTAPRKDVEDTRQLFASAGYPLAGLTIAPTALQNIFRTDWVPSLKRTVGSLYIGRGWSRIDIFADGNLVLTRGIKAGINSMAESLVDEYPGWRKQYDASDSKADMRADGDDLLELQSAKAVGIKKLELAQAQRLVQALSPDSKPETDLADEYGLDNETIFTLIKPALVRLVRQVERTFEHYTANMGRETITAMYLSTAMNSYQPMVDYIGEQLDIPSDILDPLDPDHSWVEGVTEGESVSERLAYVPALGVALSHQSRTLNLTYTQEDQKQTRKYLYANYAVLAVVGVFLLGSIGWYSWLDRAVAGKQMEVAQLERAIDQGVPATEETVKMMEAELLQDRRIASDIRDRYLAATVYGAVSAMTPEGIKLIDVRTDLGRVMVGGSRSSDRTVARSMMIDGFVTGAADALDADLIAYVMNIQSSPLFERVVINAKIPETIERREVLRFTLTASMEVPSS